MRARCGAARRRFLGTVWGLAIAGLVSAAPARAEESTWKPPAAPETALFVAAEVLVAVDVTQTIVALQGNPRLYDLNPLFGARPRPAVLVGAGAAAMLAIAAAWWFLPTPWRDAVTMPVVFVEVPNVTRNAFVMMGARF